MDKNTIIGFILIFALILGFNFLNRPSQEQLEAQRRERDSIAAVNEANRLAALDLEYQQLENELKRPTEVTDTTKALSMYGDFAYVSVGTDSFVTVESELLKLVFASRGGRLYSAELKDYKTWDKKPLILFEGDESMMDFTLLTNNNRVLQTKNLFFQPSVVLDADGNQVVTMRLPMDEDSYLDFVYTIPEDNYMIGFDIQAKNMQRYLDPSLQALDLKWQAKIRQQEKGRKFENRYATLNYKYATDNMVTMSDSRDKSEQAVGAVRWIAFKDQFFSTILIANQNFTSAQFESQEEAQDVRYLKKYRADANVVFDPTGREATNMHIFLGPNSYPVLNAYDKGLDRNQKLDLEKIIPLGWALFRWISVYLIIPVFNWFGSFIASYGLIILLLTLVIKLIILPFTFKSYMSTAKMRVLKPQIDEINAKIPADKAMERQQTTMNLYRKVGVSPMSGCLPMLLQMPFLFAMFSFFPTAIELRQQSFLWAHDLSTYDAIVSWSTYIPIITPYFGNHISLFCLLMTITNIIYTKVNMANQAQQSMPGMNMVMYLMPLMFLFMFNSYASGLTYYYLLSILITIGQTYLFRLFVNEDKLLKELEARKGKPAKKSGFMKRLEDAQRMQMEQAKKGKRK